MPYYVTERHYIAGFKKGPSSYQQILLILSYMMGDNATRRYADLFILENSHKIWSIPIDEFIEGLAETFIPTVLSHQAEKELYALKQGKGTVEDCIVRMKQLAMQANYDIKHHAKTLLRLMWQGLKNEVVEYVERAKPDLLETDNFKKWERTLVCTDQVLWEIEERKRGSWDASNRYGNATQWPRTTTAPRQNTMVPPVNNQGGFIQNQPAPIHPNQVGMFGGSGVPMDISKARAKGKCFKCGKAWLCTEHFKPCARQVRKMTFWGQELEYTTTEELVKKIGKYEKDFLVGT